MKTKLILLAGLALLTSSCDNVKYPSDDTSRVTAPVTIHVNDFSITQSEFPDTGTRAVTDVKDYKPVEAVTLALYNGNTEVYKTTQFKSDKSTYTTFGEFSCQLPIGKYKMVALGYGYFAGDEFTLTSPTEAVFTSERPREMFCLTKDVTVTKTSPLDLTVTLDRINSWLYIESTDGRSAIATKIRTTFAKGDKSFNPTTGFALSDKGFTQINNPSAKIGDPIKVGIYPFLYTDEETMDVTIEALDDTNTVLFTKTITNVAFKRGYKTTIKGPIFTAGASSVGFNLNPDWGTGETYTFD
jgi:hypothetical protein